MKKLIILFFALISFNANAQHPYGFDKKYLDMDDVETLTRVCKGKFMCEALKITKKRELLQRDKKLIAKEYRKAKMYFKSRKLLVGIGWTGLVVSSVNILCEFSDCKNMFRKQKESKNLESK